jgi:hypothetical protein
MSLLKTLLKGMIEWVFLFALIQGMLFAMVAIA